MTAAVGTFAHGHRSSLNLRHSRGAGQRMSQGSGGVIDPAQLDELPFEELVCRLAFGHKRSADARIWNRLLEPDLVVRTAAALYRAHERNASAMQTRSEEWLRYTEERVGVKVDAREWAAARQDYEDWCARAGKFAATIARAIQDVERAQRKRAREGAAAGEDPQFYRRQLKAVAEAIFAHRSALEQGDVIAEEHDLQLWSALESVTVPHGPLSEPTSLMSMLTERYWS